MSNKILYTEPKSAKYKLFVHNFYGSFDKFILRCLVLGETDKTYLIKIFDFIPKHAPGDTFYVRKRNVIFEEQKQEKVQDTSEFWYNNMESREIL